MIKPNKISAVFAVVCGLALTPHVARAETGATIIKPPASAQAPQAAPAAAAQPADDNSPVHFEAVELTHDDKNQTVTALGQVEFMQGEKILRADKIVYNLATDTVAASGNVSLMDETGDVHFAEYLELTRSMKDGYIKNLLSLLTDGSRFTATDGKREQGVKTTLNNASYTPCKVCEENPKPLWQLRAKKVIHDEKNKSIKYEDARLELAGVPLFYSPLFSHADPSVKRKSGVMRPKYGWGSDVGGYVEGSYYFGDIAPNIDATLAVRPTTKKGTLVQGEWRQRFEKGRIQINASGAQSDRKEEDGRIEENRKRGHIFANGQMDLSDTWRTGFAVENVSDKNYLRLYDITSEQVLKNRLYAERFSGRDYTSISAQSFRDLRLGLRPDQSDIFPELSHRMIGDPKGLLGGRWEAGISSLMLHRGGEDAQDVRRASLDAGWERRIISDMGLNTRLRTSARADHYDVRDNAAIAPGLEDETQATRGSALASVVTSYPLQKRLEKASWVVEPIAGAVAATKQDETDLDIPNEDSLDIQIDAANLFDDNRFTGVDRQEDGLRASYGVKTGLYGDDGKYGKVFFGQSMRFDDHGTYPQGSGLEDKNSSYVGQVGVGLAEKVQLDYRFQLNNENLSPERHEFRARTHHGPLQTSARYFYVNGVNGTGFSTSREQFELGGRWQFNQNWNTYGNGIMDLGDEPGLRRATLGFGYGDECFSMAVEGVRNLTLDAAGESETVLLFRIGFKNLGEFSAPDILLNSEVQQ